MEVVVPYRIIGTRWLCPHGQIVGQHVVLLRAIDNTPSLCSQEHTQRRRISQDVGIDRVSCMHDLLTSTYILSLVFVIANIYSSWLVAHVSI